MIHTDPDLGILPVLKCWPYDGGRFITLPVVNTIHPITQKPNAGMYRMQILDKCTTAMHWQIHKTGASHYEEWKKTGRMMPVSVTLGGDPVYTYAATAPLPENIDEYILAGFLRGRKVRLVKCLTNEIYVPEDADIVIEGYVDPAEELFWEGPFGDHTGFYSLADWYPKFHVTCITHSKDAVYPATIVGIPPMEDALIARATEKIFLAPIKLTLQPEIEDLHMPDAGVAHNLALIRIRKSYPGQGMKVINSLLGAGQMMFTKYLIVVSGEIDLRDYPTLLNHIIQNTDTSRDLFFCRGPLDVLDHSSDTFAFGGKLGIDATIKTTGEINGRNKSASLVGGDFIPVLKALEDEKLISGYIIPSLPAVNVILLISVNVSENPGVASQLAEKLEKSGLASAFRLIVIVDHMVDISDLFMVTWQLLGNSDPLRDHRYISDNCLLIDGTIKLYRENGFTRQWPNVVCSDESTISGIDKKWGTLGTGPFVSSPSLKNKRLEREGREEIKREYLKSLE
jgi:4-hydroxy-3-polyprenylbenzoate decarboxylase